MDELDVRQEMKKITRFAIGAACILLVASIALVVWTYMGEIITKLMLLALVCAPFAALVSDMLGKTEGIMTRVVIGSTIIFALGIVFGGYQERPNFVNVVFGAFCAWPILLLIAKAVRPSMPWSSIWISVPIMSWFLVNLMIGLTDGNPLRGVVGLLVAWIYLVIPFSVLSGLFVGIQRLTRRIRKGEPQR